MEVLGGPLFGVAGAGESHGPAITTTVLGCPPGLRVERAQVQHYLDRRRPGGNKLGTPRRETDQVALLSGLYAEDHDQLLAGPALLRDPGPDALRQFEFSGFAIVEQDMYPAPFDKPLPIARRTRDYFKAIEIG